VTFQDFINNLRFEQVDLILCVLATVLFSVGWYYFFYYFNPIKPSKNEPITAFPPVSIIISARNAVLKLEDNIQHWLTQDYPNFEVVIVDDRSSDETAYFLVKTAEKEPLLKYVLLDPDVIKNGSKKLALTLGIKKAKNNHFLFTDADCIPSSDQWLKQMATGFTHKKDIVLGVSPVNTKKSFLGRLTQYENLLTAMQYLGMAIKGDPYMGVGRNLAYTRGVYDGVGGFSKHHHLPAGDDDLFVQEASNANNTVVCIQPESFVNTEGPKNWKEYWKQKMRHLWIGKQYRSDVKTSLAWLPISQLLFWTIIIIWFIAGSSWLWPIIPILVKIVPEWIIFVKKGKLLNMPLAGPYYLFYNIFYSFWYVVISMNAFFKRKIVW
jgi:cellulose synthase/poly-beta-1,6-N-acetylglucosamine synthase-like glycosyltransferase